ncbi:MAG: glutamine--fructose-6-phosphate transaminase (isomerizing) [bacterium]|nr:glutamine--fructose-6-phosphate transaminase (isomerizing) [bacterium]
MCGIVGYVGPKNAASILLNGVKRVEYRGYDSAGMALLEPGADIYVIKKAGKIIEFENLLKKEGTLKHTAHLGIAHTRWATHGVPDKLGDDGEPVNAHPHLSCRKKVAVVHNGIITNFSNLKKLLESRGHKFTSDTDSEVLAHLISEYTNGDPVEAVRSALKEVEGTYGLAVVFKDHPDCIVFACNGSPVIIGINDEDREYLVVSDTASLIDVVQNQMIIEDGQIGILSRKNGYQIFDMDKVNISPKVEEITQKLEDIQLGGYPHFMLKEICHQPDSVSNTMAGRIDNGHVVLGGLEDHKELISSIKAHFMVAAGTSLYAGMIGEILLQEVSKLYTQWKNASELANQRLPLFPDHSAVWAITQSGETADLRLAIKKAKEYGLPIFGIPNVVGSSVARDAGKGIYINAGPEQGVASTKAFTSQVMVLNLLALYLRHLHHIKHEPWIDKYVANIKKIPDQIASIVDRKDEIHEIAKKYLRYKNFLYLGRGINYPVAMEGALKLKEISYLHAEGYSSGEMKHGPIAMIDENLPTIIIAPTKDDYYDKIISNIQEITARGGPVLALANEGDTEIANHVNDVIYVPSTTYYLMPLLFVIPLQLLAYYIAVELGNDVDQPRNLAKAVTVE